MHDPRLVLPKTSTYIYKGFGMLILGLFKVKVKVLINQLLQKKKIKNKKKERSITWICYHYSGLPQLILYIILF